MTYTNLMPCGFKKARDDGHALVTLHAHPLTVLLLTELKHNLLPQNLIYTQRRAFYIADQHRKQNAARAIIQRNVGQ